MKKIFDQRKKYSINEKIFHQRKHISINENKNSINEKIFDQQKKYSINEIKKFNQWKQKQPTEIKITNGNKNNQRT